jgi:hypothetical protein
MENDSRTVSRIIPRRKTNIKSVAREADMEEVSVSFAISLAGKYSKQVLERLEAKELLTKEIRKDILDGFGDYRRELERLLLDA